MADDEVQKNPINETVPGGPNPAEARTEPGDAHSAAVTYSAQAEKGKGTQDPFPYDPTNELLDGDDSPSRSELAARGVQVSASGRALVSVDDPTGLEIPPPAHANLELDKAHEKRSVAADEAIGVDPEIGRQARAQARTASAKARKDGATERTADGDTAEARRQAPQGRSRTGGTSKA
jgi:hypothetical protein